MLLSQVGSLWGKFKRKIRSFRFVWQMEQIINLPALLPLALIKSSWFSAECLKLPRDLVTVNWLPLLLTSQLTFFLVVVVVYNITIKNRKISLLTPLCVGNVIVVRFSRLIDWTFALGFHLCLDSCFFRGWERWYNERNSLVLGSFLWVNRMSGKLVRLRASESFAPKLKRTEPQFQTLTKIKMLLGQLKTAFRLGSFALGEGHFHSQPLISISLNTFPKPKAS